MDVTDAELSNGLVLTIDVIVSREECSSCWKCLYCCKPVGNVLRSSTGNVFSILIEY